MTAAAAMRRNRRAKRNFPASLARGDVLLELIDALQECFGLVPQLGIAAFVRVADGGFEGLRHADQGFIHEGIGFDAGRDAGGEDDSEVDGDAELPGLVRVHGHGIEDLEQVMPTEEIEELGRVDFTAVIELLEV